MDWTPGFIRPRPPRGRVGFQSPRAIGIQNGREDAGPGRHPDAGEVRNPYPVWLIGDGIAVEVWEDRRGRAGCRLSAQSACVALCQLRQAA